MDKNDAVEQAYKRGFEEGKEHAKPKGKWEINCDGYYPYCSECKNEPMMRGLPDFCPNCGADMRGGRQNDNGV